MIWRRLHLFLLLLLLLMNTSIPTEQEVTLLIVLNGSWGRRAWYFVKVGHPFVSINMYCNEKYGTMNEMCTCFLIGPSYLMSNSGRFFKVVFNETVPEFLIIFARRGRRKRGGRRRRRRGGRRRLEPMTNGQIGQTKGTTTKYRSAFLDNIF